MSGGNLDDLTPDALRRLTEAGVPTPRADLELLIAHVLGVSRGEAAAAVVAGRRVTEEQVGRLTDLVDDRSRRIPLQHLTGLAPFRGLELRVGPGVFVPRPETEQVAQLALDRLAALAPPTPRVIDLGTGSGALAAAIAAEVPDAEVHAVEVSPQAAAWARMNLEPLGVRVHEEDLRTLPQTWDATFDVVVSNPPYIPPGMVPRDPEVRDHDPQTALYGGGEDGLAMPRATVAAARRLLRPGGWFVLEHAEAQAAPMREHLRRHRDLEEVTTHRDLTGRDRATSAVVRTPTTSEPTPVHAPAQASETVGE
ncbi:MAG: peptide chain release factor N(5)-glutamine methyltransferase [Nesterenkonia sp.]|nr:peptide chain release factor N(5)-glutamine methyltransferase [Nesterenkonia sp.]